MKPARQFLRTFKTFAEAWAAADADGRYTLDERAAIIEFDGNVPKAEAEARALKEHNEKRQP